MARPKKKPKDSSKRRSISFSKGGLHVEQLRELAGGLERSKAVDCAVLLAVRLFKEKKLEPGENFYLSQLFH